MKKGANRRPFCFLSPAAPVQQSLAAPPAPPVTDAAQAEPPDAPQPTAGATVKALKEAMLALTPTGEGDPNAVTCRVPQLLPGSRLPGPEICKTNSVWAKLRAEGEDISPDGAHVIATLSHNHGLLAVAGNCYSLNQLPGIQYTGPLHTLACY